MTDTKPPPPAWVTDDTIMPPYPVLRCPRCKALFSDHAIHICRDINQQLKDKT
jgi:hypothetical protein